MEYSKNHSGEVTPLYFVSHPEVEGFTINTAPPSSDKLDPLTLLTFEEHGVSGLEVESPSNISISTTSDGFVVRTSDNLKIEKFSIENRTVINSVLNLTGQDIVVNLNDTHLQADLNGDGLIDQILQPPVPAFEILPSQPIVGDTITFNASSSYDSDGSIVSYSWNFGDGSSASGVTVTHSYSQLGTYTVTLTVTDDEGLESTISKVITVSEVAPPSQMLPGIRGVIPNSKTIGLYPFTSGNPVNLSFGEWWSYEGSGNAPLTFKTGDLDGDGDLEVVTGQHDLLKVFDANGSVLWEVQVPGVVTYYGRGNLYVNLLEDVNGDGKLEIFCSRKTSTYEGIIYVYDWQGNLIKSFTRNVANDGSIAARAVIDQNGEKFVLVSIESAYGANPRGASLFNYTSGQEVWYYAAGTAFPLTMDDLDGDGKLEISSYWYTVNNGANGCGTGSDTCTDDHSTYILIINEYGQEVLTMLTPDDSPDNGNAYTYITDLDNDGEKELLVLHTHSSTYYPGNEYLQILDTNGSVMRSYNMGPGDADWMAGVAVGDINNDSFDEIIVAHHNQKLVLFDYQLNKLGELNGYDWVYLNDVDGDGDIEILTKNVENSEIAIFSWNGSFAKEWSLTGFLGYAFPSDLDNDGINELILSNQNSITILKNNLNSAILEEEITTISVGSAMVLPNETVWINITVSNITAPDGIGAWSFNLTFDPSVVSVLDVQGVVGKSINNDVGWARFNWFGTSSIKTNGTVIARVKLSAIGKVNDTSPLNLEIISLYDPNANSIPARVVNGTIYIIAQPPSFADPYEPDDTMDSAAPINISEIQHHNFHQAGDVDWIKFYATVGTTYIIETFNLSANSDTYIYLYDSNGNLIAENDDYSGLASRIEWTCQQDGYYYVKIRHFDNNAYGYNTDYWIWIWEALVTEKLIIQGNAKVLWNLTIPNLIDAYILNDKDYDGDGLPDIIAVSQDVAVRKVRAISGANGNIVWTTKIRNSDLSWPISAGDLDGDGVEDIVVISHTWNETYYYPYEFLTAISGSDGSILWDTSVIQGWMWVYKLDDIDGDGKNDLLIEYRMETIDEYGNVLEESYKVSAVKGSTGAEIWSRSYSMSTLDGWSWGNSMPTGDLNGDGLTDVLINVHHENYNSVSQDFLLAVTSTNTTLWEVNASRFALPGDLDGDSLNDVVIYNGGTVAIRGYDAAVLWTAVGDLISVIGDLNTDGVSDVLIEGNNWLYALNGNNGLELWGLELNDSTIVHYQLTRDLNGDGARDVIFVLENEQWNDTLMENVADVSVLAVNNSGDVLWILELGKNLIYPWVWIGYAGDLDGDGVGDLVAQMYYEEIDTSSGYTDYVPTGKFIGIDSSGNVLWSYEAYWWWYGALVIGDFDGNGKSDVVEENFYTNSQVTDVQSINQKIKKLINIRDKKYNYLIYPLGPDRFGSRQGAEYNIMIKSISQVRTTAATGYTARAFPGDDINQTIWKLISNETVNWIGRIYYWNPDFSNREPGIDFNGDGLMDASPIVDDTIYVLVNKNVSTPIPIPTPTLIYSSSASIKLNSTGEVTVSVNSSTLIGSLQLNIYFNPSIVQAIDFTPLTNAITSYNIDNITGLITVGMVSLDGIGNSLFKVTFKGVAEGTTPVNITVIDLTDTSNNPLNYSVINGSITVYIRMKGDTNDDGRITASDALLYLRYAVGQDISPYYLSADDDVTCDNRITAADALKVLRKAVGQDLSNEACPWP
jgi:hypothetical protein